MFQSVVQHRNVADILAREVGSVVSNKDSFILKHIHEHRDHFTVITIRIRDSVAKTIKNSRSITEVLGKDLADIYHFFLHPDDTPQTYAERFLDEWKRSVRGCDISLCVEHISFLLSCCCN